MRDSGKSDCIVVKNALAERAFSETQFESIKPFLKGPSLLILGKEEATTAIKTFLEFQKKVDPLLALKGGVIAGDTNALDSKSLKQIGDLPSKEVLLAQIAGSLTSCPSQIVQAINQTISSIGDLSVKVAEQQNK